MVETTTNPDTSAQVADRLRPVLLHLGRHLRREVTSLGVTPGQLSLMAGISKESGIGVGELAEREQMSAPAMCVHIDKLEAAGLVARTRVVADRRRVGLSLTDDGQRVLRAARKRRTAWLATRLERLDDRERAAIETAIEPLQRLLIGTAR